jgi:hypothetical protein
VGSMSSPKNADGILKIVGNINLNQTVAFAHVNGRGLWLIQMM